MLTLRQLLIIHPPPSAVHDNVDDIQEVIPIKPEPIHHVQEALAEPQAYSSSISMDSAHGQSLTAYQEDTGYEEYGDYEDQAYSQGDIQQDQPSNMQGQEQSKGKHTHKYSFNIKQFHQKPELTLLRLGFLINNNGVGVFRTRTIFKNV